MDLTRAKIATAKIISGFFLFSLLFSACTTPKKIGFNTFNPGKYFKQNQIFTQEFSGFTLFDIDQNRYLARVNESKHFTPASNTKIITLYSALTVLKDSLPVLRYFISGDSLLFSGTGNPLNLNPYFQNNQQLTGFLAKSEKELFYVPAQPAVVKYGPGWAWDDAMEYYQLENNDLPVYGNEIHLRIRNDSLTVHPEYWAKNIQIQPSENDLTEALPGQNSFLIRYHKDQNISIPFSPDASLVCSLLSDTLGKTVNLHKTNTDQIQWKTYRISFPDSLLIRMMQVSDNFIAEQLLLMTGLEVSGVMDRQHAIEHLKLQLSGKLTDDYRWVDGSGLSRYNLFTPGNMTEILLEIYRMKGFEWITEVFPQGGVSGTIDTWYDPYVFAKTGSLSNNHCLSGFIRAKSGKIYIFSFMHNHFIGSSRKYKEEMDTMLKKIHEKY